MATKKKMLMSAAGSAGGASLDIDDVFNTYLYTGTEASTQTITNGIDLAGEGGLVWAKARDDATNHVLMDTEQGVGKFLNSNQNYAQQTNSEGMKSFNSDGFTFGTQTGVGWSNDHVYWTFRKASKFFDVVKYTGDGTTHRDVPHNLGSAPGWVITKRFDSSNNWMVYSRASANEYKLHWFTSDAVAVNYNPSNSSYNWTDSVFYASSQYSFANTNEDGATYISYLFANNNGDGEFGPDSDQDVIKCGSYTGNGVAGHVINLGFEAQWVMIKRTDGNADWVVYDAMRGMPNEGNGKRLRPNTYLAESDASRIGANSNGFALPSVNGQVNQNNANYIYMAIRRGPLASPESATEVFAIDASPNSSFPVYEAGFPVDLGIKRYDYPSAGNSYFVGDRVRGGRRLVTNATNSEANTSDVAFDSQVGWWTQPENSTSISWMWKRAPGFCDVVAYKGLGAAGSHNHNLGAVPEMIWFKARDDFQEWIVYHKDLTAGKHLRLNGTNAELAGELTTSFAVSDTQFTFANDFATTNSSSTIYMAYLFSSLPGISKVGSYTGNGSSQTIDCGFTSGARFVLIKRTDSTGSWVLYDTERGIVSGNDAALLLQSSGAEYSGADEIDPNSSGFDVVHDANGFLTNASGATYIFYAIA
jgi:hypothetical protein